MGIWLRLGFRYAVYCLSALLVGFRFWHLDLGLIIEHSVTFRRCLEDCLFVFGIYPELV